MVLGLCVKDESGGDEKASERRKIAFVANFRIFAEFFGQFFGPFFRKSFSFSSSPFTGHQPSFTRSQKVELDDIAEATT